MKNVFEFARKYFTNPNIINYIDLHEAQYLECKHISLSNLQALLCFKINGRKKEYVVDSFVYNNQLIKYDNGTFKLMTGAELDRDKVFWVIIGFDSINISLKKFLSKIY